MTRWWFEVFASLTITLTVSASGIVYITDLPAFSSLAPCAAGGVSYIVQGLSNSACPAPVTALESCACTKDQNAAVVLSSITSWVLHNCASTATEDVTSASIVFSGYCNQGATITTPPPASHTVSQYLSQLTAYSNLAPCAAEAISYVVQALTANLCPAAPSALASCACTKNQNSLAVSESINSLVFQYCGKTHSEDVTSAQGVFKGYCALGAGTTSFATPSALSGDVSYYITDLPTYSALAPCASDALSYVVQSQTGHDCPAAPLSLVSCACVKDQNSQGLSSDIASMVSQYCGSTASEDITSALGVFDYYCSAGKGLVKPQGITASLTAAASSGNAAQQTSSNSNYGPTATSGAGYGSSPTSGGSSSGGSSSGGSSSGGSNAGGPSSNNSGSSVPIAPIVGGVVGGVFALSIFFWVIWLYRRRRRPPPPQFTGENGARDDYGKPELPANSSGMAAAGGTISRKPLSSGDINKTVSPVSPASEKVDALLGATELPSPRSPRAVELHNSGAPRGAEVPGDSSRHEMSGIRDVAELHNQPPQSELQGSTQNRTFNRDPIYEMPDRRWAD